MRDDQIFANSFFIRPDKLQIFRVQRHGTATIYWTSRVAHLRYLQDMQTARSQSKNLRNDD